MTPGELARAAARMLEKRGFHQGDFGYCDGPVCILGALTLAFGGRSPRDVPSGDPCEWDEVRHGLECVMRVKNIVAWNDEPGRTLAQCVDALERTANYLDKRQ